MRKHLYILLVLVAIVSAYMVACKNKPTAMAEFIEEPEVVDNTETLTADDTIEDYSNLRDAVGKYFESVYYYATTGSGQIKFKYTLEIKSSTYAQGGTLVEFKGWEKDKNSGLYYEFTRTYTGTSRLGNHKFALVKATGGGDGDNRADIEFNATTKIAHFQPSSYNFVVKAAAKKTKTTS